MVEHDGESSQQPDAWVTDLLDRLVEAGHARQQVDELIVATLAQFRAARVRNFVPVLVERSVQQALRAGDRQSA